MSNSTGSRIDPGAVPREERRLADIAEASQLHDETLEPHGEPAVRRNAVLEGLEVRLERLDREAAIFERGQVIPVPM